MSETLSQVADVVAEAGTEEIVATEPFDELALSKWCVPPSGTSMIANTNAATPKHRKNRFRAETHLRREDWSLVLR